VGTDNDGASEQEKEDNKQEEVEDSIANDSSLAELGLLQRVNWRTDLTTWSKPEQHDGMELVRIRNQQDWKHEEEKDMSQNEVGGEHSQLSNLAEEFTTRLADSVPSHGVPFTSPPSDIGGIGLEFSSKGERDDELEDESLNSDHSNHTGQSPREAEALEEHEDHEEDKEDNDGDGVSNSSQNGTEFLAAHAEERSSTASEREESS